jgi:PHD/YefM family antitoxin component YafN of YafNO toxin-antitoxin module
METATIRIPEEKKNLLKAVASLENRKMNDLIVDLIDEYVDRRKETLQLMAVPGLYEQIRASSREFRQGRTVSMKDARKKLER